MASSRSRPPAGDESPSIAVVKEVAAREGTEPTELRPPLYREIDSDALDQLFAATGRGGPRSGRVTFTYCGYVVRVGSDGRVTVEEEG